MVRQTPLEGPSQTFGRSRGPTDLVLRESTVSGPMHERHVWDSDPKSDILFPGTVTHMLHVSNLRTFRRNLILVEGPRLHLLTPSIPSGRSNPYSIIQVPPPQSVRCTPFRPPRVLYTQWVTRRVSTRTTHVPPTPPSATWTEGRGFTDGVSRPERGSE